MRSAPFTRPTLLAALEVIQSGGHNALDRAVLQLGLERQVSADPGQGVAKKGHALSRAVLDSISELLDTLEGSMTRGEAAVREAIRQLRPNTPDQAVNDLVRGLARDGFIVEQDINGGPGRLRAALPGEIQLAETDDEVRQLLRHFGFNVPAGHLEQAIEAHTRGDWAACNSQLRTFMESLLDTIAHWIRKAPVPLGELAENRRAYLAEKALFLSIDRKEWSPDGKAYIPGLFKMLHTEGSHPGLSNEDHATFRLHLVLVTARTFLRRLRYDSPVAP